MQVSHKMVESESIMTYSDIDIYPEEKYGYRVGTGLDNGERVVFLSVKINPIQYKPSLFILFLQS